MEQVLLLFLLYQYRNWGPGVLGYLSYMSQLVKDRMMAGIQTCLMLNLTLFHSSVLSAQLRGHKTWSDQSMLTFNIIEGKGRMF